MTRPKIGIFADCTDVSMPILDLAVEAERRGFEGLFLNEHTHLPVHAPRSQFPAGGPTPPRYALLESLRGTVLRSRADQRRLSAQEQPDRTAEVCLDLNLKP